MIELSVGSLTRLGLTAAILLSGAGWLFKEWISARIDKSIQYEYDKQLEDYKDSRMRRQKAALIAELFSKWIKYYGRETNLLDPDQLMEHYAILNRLSIELSLWLGDEQIYQDVMNRLQNLEGARDLRELVGDVRAYLLEKDRASFNAQSIVLWPLPTEIDRIYGPRE